MRSRDRGDEPPCRNVGFLIYDLERGGPEVRLLDLARLRPSDLEMRVFVTSTHLAMLPEFSSCGVRVDAEPIARPYVEPRRVARLRAAIRGAELDVLNVFDLKGLMIALLPRRIRPGRRPALVFHSVNAHDGFSRTQRLLLMGAMNACDAVLCNSHYSRDLLLKEGLRRNHRIEVIQNGVDTEHFRRSAERRTSVRAACGFAEDDAVLGTVANFRPQKDYPLLLEAYRELLARHPRLRLLCVGGGPLLPSMRELADRLGLQGKVAFTGYTDDVAGHLSAMDVFALASKWEGFPNALLQAMSCGVPVVSSAVGGCAEVVADGEDGLLFAAGNLAGITEAVSRILGDPRLAGRIGRAGFSKAQERFSIPKMVERYATFFRGL